MKYVKETPRLVVKFIDSETEEVLFEIRDRNWMNIGELFTTHYVTTLMEQEYKNKNKPKNVIVMIAEEYSLIQ
jgi:hypothetical protein